MRSLLALLACLMLVTAAGSGTAQASPACSEMADQVVVHIAGDCDEVPADAHKNYPHCHTGCHGHHATVAVPVRAPADAFPITCSYAWSIERTLTAHQIDRTLRPPRT